MRVLLVDDDDLVRSAERRLLVSLGHEVESWASAQGALDHVNVTAPDCALLDVNMPGTDGLELAGALRARFPRLPIALVTGSDASAERAEAAGFLVLRKPFHADELCAALAVLETFVP